MDGDFASHLLQMIKVTTMSHEATQTTEQTLGSYLREQRQQKGLSLSEVSASTKISLPILNAIEDDDYKRMPADAFCRGFYNMYAKLLELDPQEILTQYEAGRGIHPKTSRKPAKPPLRESQKFANYADPAPISPVTSMTFFITACLVIFIGGCWYFNFNPINYISSRLIPPQSGIETVEQFTVVPEEGVTINPSPSSDSSNPEGEVSSGIPSATTLSVTDKETTETLPKEGEKDSSAIAPYHLKIDFNSSGTLKVTLDDGFILDKNFNAGESLEWKVEKKIILDMPESLSGTLTLNGIEIPLPETENNRRLLSLPEDLLD